MAYKYLVTDKASGSKRLIEASSPANAIAHVAKDGFTTERISDAVAGMLGLPVEKVTEGRSPATAETAPEVTPEPQPEPEAKSGKK